MNEEALHSVKTSYGRCLVNGDVFQEFYELFLMCDPRIAPMFKNTDFSQQRELLRHSLNQALLFAEGSPVGKEDLAFIRKSHSKKELNVHPSLYPLWIDSFLKTVEKMDDKLTPEVKDNWRTALSIAVDFIKAGYDE